MKQPKVEIWMGQVNLIPESEADLIDSLPHGSGINADWVIEYNTAGKVVAYNSYHVLDENGYYRIWVDFSIRWAPGEERDFRLMFHTDSSGRYWVDYTGLREYLEDTIAYCFSEARRKA